MNREILIACLPWLGIAAGGLAALYGLVRLNRAKPRWTRLARLHSDQAGSAQSLSFVLTLPIFVWVMMLIVQVSQIMIGTIVVHYAAFAAARAAIVWTPVRLGALPENCTGGYSIDPESPDQQFPVSDPTSAHYGPADGGVTYLVTPGGVKHQKISSAAIMACMAISPSRDTGMPLSSEGIQALDILSRAYLGMVPGSSGNPRTTTRLRNKLAYAMQATDVRIRFYHSNHEPPLVEYLYTPTPPYRLLYEPIRIGDPPEFVAGQELGWQDPIEVTVTHYLALLPGPGRLLAYHATGPDGRVDPLADTIQRQGNLYVYPIKASATLNNEGEKPVVPYVYHVY
jgi:hypothetical protein